MVALRNEVGVTVVGGGGGGAVFVTTTEKFILPSMVYAPVLASPRLPSPICPGGWLFLRWLLWLAAVILAEED